MPGLTGLSGLSGLSGLVGGYSDKVLSYNPIAYWPLWETVGGTAIDQVNSPAQDGAYTGVTLGQTVTDANGVTFLCPFFDGANDFVNIWSTTFRDAFNGSEGSVMCWARVFNVGVWTDGNDHIVTSLLVNATNNVILKKDNLNGRKELIYEAGGVSEIGVELGLAITDWMQLVFTWSATADEVKQYRDGSQVGGTLGTLGVWVGLLSNVQTLIGAVNMVPASPWYGWLSHCAVWDTVLTQPQIADLATI